MAMDFESMVGLTADIVSAHLSNNSVALSDIPDHIARVHGALTALGTPTAEKIEPLVPAVPVRSSVKPDYIVCLEDGKKFKTLKRHLGVHYGLSPDEYRAKWGLPSDYPMVAPSYAKTRSETARRLGLGRKPGYRRGKK